jgi:hypothetical protein
MQMSDEIKRTWRWRGHSNLEPDIFGRSCPGVTALHLRLFASCVISSWMLARVDGFLLLK